MATKRWVGGAPATTRIMTITVANTWATSDVANVTVNNKTLTVTIGAIATTAGVAAALVAAINATSKTSGLVGTESRNFGGQEIAEFRAFTATLSGSTVILTAVGAGEFFLATVSETTAGTGDLAIAVTVAGTGPNDLGNAANYDGGALLSNDDTLRFDSGSQDVTIGLDYYRTAGSIDFHVEITGDYKGTIGRPLFNEKYGHDDYGTRMLQCCGSTDAYDFEVLPGESSAGGLGGGQRGTIYADFDSQAMQTLAVKDSRRVFLRGGTCVTLALEKGEVDTDLHDGSNPTGLTPSLVLVGVPGGQENDLKVTFGVLTVLTGAGSISVRSGTVTVLPATNGVTMTILGGVVLDSSTNVGPIIVGSGGKFCSTSNGGSINTATLNGGVLDCDKGFGSVDVTTVTMSKGSELLDRGGRIPAAADIVLSGCSPRDVTLEFPAGKTLTLG